MTKIVRKGNVVETFKGNFTSFLFNLTHIVYVNILMGAKLLLTFF